MAYRAEEKNIRLLLAGDAMPARSLKPFDEPQYQALLDLVRGADAAFANLETTVREPNEGTPNLTQGTPMSTPPALLDELGWMGLKLLSCANNHATDYGDDGLLAMLAHLRRAGLALCRGRREFGRGTQASLCRYRRRPGRADCRDDLLPALDARRRSAARRARPAGREPGRFRDQLHGRRSRLSRRSAKRASNSGSARRGPASARCSSAPLKRRKTALTR